MQYQELTINNLTFIKPDKNKAYAGQPCHHTPTTDALLNKIELEQLLQSQPARAYRAEVAIRVSYALLHAHKTHPDWDGIKLINHMHEVERAAEYFAMAKYESSRLAMYRLSQLADKLDLKMKTPNQIIRHCLDMIMLRDYLQSTPTSVEEEQLQQMSGLPPLGAMTATLVGESVSKAAAPAHNTTNQDQYPQE